jgi:hypothetical protein
MKTRGKILRQPNSGPGLLMIDGQQFRFELDGVWKSDAAPTVGQAVDVSLDQNLQITEIKAVPESQITREQAEVAVSLAKKKGGEVARKTVARFGAPTLIATGILLVGWFFLTFFTISVPLAGKADFTFWQTLGLVNSSNALDATAHSTGASAGIYALLALVALTGPFVRHFWNDKRAVLGGLAPLLFMLVIWIMTRSSIQTAFAGNASGPFAELGREASSEIMKDVSLGFGAYIGGLVGVYFAAMAVRGFVGFKRGENHEAEQSRPAAA